MNETEFWLPGTPATFATAGERPWKEAIAASAPPPSLNGNEQGIHLSFVVETMTPGGMPRDLDNLVEPVLSALVNRVGWFGGRRPNIREWSATVVPGAKTGCRVLVRSGISKWAVSGAPDFQGVYSGPLPRSARAPEVPDWLTKQPGVDSAWELPSLVELHLAFGGERTNLGDIATGVVKSLIDCLYPLLGGVAGAPEDHRVRWLRVRKGAEGLVEGQVEIRLWRREDL